MKKFLILISALFALTCQAQTDNFYRITPTTSIITREENVIVITKDPSTVELMSGLDCLAEAVPCYDSTVRGAAMMFWFPVEYLAYLKETIIINNKNL